MNDLVLQYLIQFGAITAGAMGLSEWLTIKRVPFTSKGFGVEGKSRKRLNAWLYATALGALGVVADMVVLPGELWYEKTAGLLVLSTVSTAAGHLVHMSTKAVVGKVKGK
jgi:hypothetical protein